MKTHDQTNEIEEILCRAIAPGMSSPATIPDRGRVSESRTGREEIDPDLLPLADALLTVADRVSSAARNGLGQLVICGAVTTEEASKIIWDIENAAGAKTHCLPGSGVYDSSSYDGNPADYERASGKPHMFVVGGDGGAGCAGLTARGFATNLINRAVALGPEPAWVVANGASGRRDNLARLTEVERAALKAAAEITLASLATLSDK